MARDISDICHRIDDNDSVKAARIFKINLNFLNYDKFKDLYNSGKIAEKISTEYNVPLEQVFNLAKDPDHGNKSTVSSFIETMVGLELEHDGILGLTVGRGPSMTDLKDGWNRKWDVKAPPKVSGIAFDVNSAINSIQKKFSEFPKGDIGILLCVSFLDLDNYFLLQKTLKNALSPNELYRVRQVEIRGLT